MKYFSDYLISAHDESPTKDWPKPQWQVEWEKKNPEPPKDYSLKALAKRIKAWSLEYPKEEKRLREEAQRVLASHKCRGSG